MTIRRLLPAAGTAALLSALVAMSTVAAGGAPDEEETMETDQTEPAPALLFIQGRLAPDGAEIYERYLAGTGPLMAEYGAEVLVIGAGVASEHTSDAWPINAVLRFPDRERAEGFLDDPRYLDIKERYRDRAYETLHLTLVAGRPPRVRGPKQVAEEAFEDFRQGLASGEWQPFLDRLSDEFTFHFPTGRFQGLNHGKERAAEFFDFVSQAFQGGLTIEEVERITAEENRVVFEFRDRGELRGQPYHNLVAISLDVCGEEICGYREYFGLVGPPPAEDEE